ncbi:hypothetical protein D6774_01740 [Candidatus Woesearchaeota archaeon]|jgi:hypothetical protein|nr:MAG: hypothetical protein D6774_01740 [Candidatus Woesearchaeota archaeon]
MKDALDEAKEELKRADHQVFVSLKYTRTVDVLKHSVTRIMNTYDFLFTSLCRKLVEEGKISEVPIAPIPRAKRVKEAYEDNEAVQEAVESFLHLRKIDKAEFDRSREFRRHVTMHAFLSEDIIEEVNIDKVTEWYKKVKEFTEYVENKLL